MKMLAVATEARIKSPRRASLQNSLIWSQRIRLFSSRSINTAPKVAPKILPEPPKIFTPPTTTAATDFSSKPIPATTVMFPNLARNKKPVSPANAPQSRKLISTILWVGTK